MLYNIAYEKDKTLLKVVVGNFLCEIPYEMLVPEAFESGVLAVAVLPQTTMVTPCDSNIQEEVVGGVKVMLYLVHGMCLPKKNQ
jgi:hypothetical protein